MMVIIIIIIYIFGPILSSAKINLYYINTKASILNSCLIIIQLTSNAVHCFFYLFYFIFLF